MFRLEITGTFVGGQSISLDLAVFGKVFVSYKSLGSMVLQYFFTGAH